MSAAADSVIGRTLLRGSAGMKSTPRTEVGLIAAVTLGGITDLAKAWRPLLSSSGLKLSVTGVFCHAAPLVRFKRPNGEVSTCELADLLVVVDRQGAEKPIRIASLIQAKMAGKAMRAHLTGPSSVRQLDLYQFWPTFSFVDRVYGPDVYNLKSKTTEDAGMFGIIHRHFKNAAPTPPLWTQHFPKPTPQVITNEPLLGTFIANMAAANASGYGRVGRPGGKDDWSKVVDLLLQVTCAKAFRHTSTLGAAAPQRGNTAMAYFLTTPSVASLGGRADGSWWPPFEGFEVMEDDAPGGISLLHLTLAALEEGIA
jgi:hypothetical protein